AALARIEERRQEEKRAYAASLQDLRTANQQKKDEEAKAFQEREAQAALQYVRERQEQRRHLGEMLIDYIHQQVNLGKASTDRGAALVDQIAKQYGVQQTISEKTTLEMRKNIDAALQSATGDTSQMLTQLDTAAQKMREQQELRDKLTEQI